MDCSVDFPNTLDLAETQVRGSDLHIARSDFGTANVPTFRYRINACMIEHGAEFRVI
eukprot:COSAG05_NODE_19179_length_296_cov_1.269036_1_plen_56_part_10